jgi:peptidoglycan hydrolase-like protein with peptidoglycan-binding domain
MPPVNKPELGLGDTGADVEELQRLLQKRLGNITVPGVPNLSQPSFIDADFGNSTELAVIAFQKQFTLPPPYDGVVGNRTWTALLQRVFPDIQSHWAADYITQMAYAEIVKGDDLGKFNPDAPINRAQFATLITVGFDPVATIRPGKEFSDVPRSFWAYDAIQKAYKAGFISGFDDGTFKPALNTLRQEAMITLAKALGNRADERPDVLNRYTDANSITAYAKTGVALATLHGIVVNFPKKEVLNPTRAATRAEVSAMLSRALTVQVKKGITLSHRAAGQPIDSAYVVSVS